jgi:hypothetical protein
MISTCRFQTLSEQSESIFHLFLVFYGWRCGPVQFPKATEEALRIIIIQLVSHFPYYKACEKNQPVSVWWNSCTGRLPMTFRATPAAIGKRQAKIISWPVLLLAIFLKKGELVSIWCESQKNFKDRTQQRSRFCCLTRQVERQGERRTYSSGRDWCRIALI